ncbi:MAG: FKBP-type peptidyl-prolyl cis-trans isomerase [Bacteroidales bacterium]|nr:FKBP-type peptidyl-prolyl cis-trans isomerase [Bacteroidales bacterium]
MIKKIFALLAVAAGMGSVTAQAQVMTAAEVDSLSRAAATIMADGVNRSVASLQGTGVDVDEAIFNAALIKGLNGEDTGFTLQTADEFIGRMVKRMNQAYAGQQAAFVDSVASLPGARRLAGDVVLVTEREGTGASPVASDRVKVNYQGRLSNGVVFDDTKGEPVTFDVNRLVPGFTEGLENMKTGGKYRLVIPAAMGYGENGIQGVIPGNSALDFTVELLAIDQPETPTPAAPASDSTGK